MDIDQALSLDELRTLALGADSAMYGRLMVYGATVGGTRGGARAFRILHSAVDKVLAQLGCRRLDALGIDHVRRADCAALLPH